MALTRKFLKALGIEDEKIDQIIEEHTAVADRMNGEIEKYKTDAAKLPTLQKELESVRAELSAAKDDGWKEKHDKVKREFDEYKAGVTAKEAKAAKEAAVRAWYQQKGITGRSLEIAMRGSSDEIAALELDEKGSIKDAKALEALVTGDFADLVGRTRTEGARTETPHQNGGVTMTKADIYKKDDHGRYVLSAAERQKALMDNQIL